LLLCPEAEWQGTDEAEWQGTVFIVGVMVVVTGVAVVPFLGDCALSMGWRNRFGSVWAEEQFLGSLRCKIRKINTKSPVTHSRLQESPDLTEWHPSRPRTNIKPEI